MAAEKRTDEPAFKVTYMGTGHEYKIWADGYTEGFPPNSVVSNRIPKVIAEAIEGDRRFHDLPGEDN